MSQCAQPARNQSAYRAAKNRPPVRVTDAVTNEETDLIEGLPFRPVEDPVRINTSQATTEPLAANTVRDLRQDEYQPYTERRLPGAAIAVEAPISRFESDDECEDTERDNNASRAATCRDETTPSDPELEARIAKASRRYAPFSSQESYDLAHHIVQYDMSVTETNDMLKAKWIRPEALQDFRSSYTLRRLIARMPDSLGWNSWHKGDTGIPKTLEHGSGTVTFWYRNVLRIARFLVNQPAFSQYMRWEPVKIHNQHGVRVYRDMETANWWWAEQVCRERNISMRRKLTIPDRKMFFVLEEQFFH